MPPRLVLQFLGLPQVLLDDRPISTDRRKAIALLAYLAVNDVGRSPQKYSREALSALLWPDYDQAKAFSNLRTILWELRQAIGEGWLIADRETVYLNDMAEIDLDVAQFLNLLSQSRQQNDLGLRIPLLSEATQLYRDHFLIGFSLKDAPNFNEWAFAEAEELRRKLADALTTLSEDHCVLSQADKAVTYARRLVALDPLNEAAHRQLMEVYWQAGQHSAALKQYQACEQILRKELNLDPQPETRALYKKILKGEVKPVRVEKQIETTTPKNNLPLQLSSFIGREKEQEEVIRLVKKNRLVTLVGVGGIGKTRLSIQTASELLNEFPNGTWLVEFAPLSDPALMPQVILSTLGLIEQEGRLPLNILIDFLQKKRALLILDNCEHLIQASAELAETLLRACPDLHTLATSREALNIPGETLYLVPSLTTPDPIHATPEILTDYEAVQLLVERAQATLSNFSITHENAIAIAQVCYHLDGIPLALELAAARVKGLGIEQIASFLHDRFRLLTGGSRTALPRHQTLQGMIDWSHDLLSKPERVLLRRLSVFAGGWSLQAAESVCAGDGLESDQILDLLLRLVDKSLVVAETQGTEPRYHMLETIRQYAHEKLWAASEGEIMRGRHLAYFVDLAERAEPNLRAFDMVIWLDRLETELDNIRIVMEYALESDIEAHLRTASALLWFWHIRGHRNEGIDWLEHGLSIEKAERADKPITPGRAMIRGKALNATGILTGEALVGKIAEYFEESLALFKELGPVGKQGMAYALWGLVGRIENRETKKHEQVLSLFREIGDKFGIAQSLTGIAFLARLSGDFERARAVGEEQLALRKEIGDKDGIANAQAQLGMTVSRQGDYQYARELYEGSLAGFREVGNTYYVGMALSLLSDIAQEKNDHEQAAKFLQEGLSFAQNTGNLFITARILNNLGKLARAQRKYQLAEKRFNEGINVCRKCHDKFEMAFALLGLGRVSQSQNDYATARSFYSKVLVIGQDIRNDFIETVCLSAYVTLALAQRKPDKAARLGGAVEKRIPSIRLEMSPLERAEYDQAIAAARAALGEEAFIAAYEEGKKMTLDEAIVYALEDKG
jgi:predicted ATPase/DNA-binding SARP family transcriptional activator/Tfp pilus assembly protein PilF